MRVLILDDDDTRHAAFETALPNATRVHARTAAEAIALLDGERFDLVYLGLELGDDDDDPAPERTVELHGDTKAKKIGPERAKRTRALNGSDVARAIAGLAAKRRPDEVIIHSLNPRVASRMRDVLFDAGIAARVEPFKQPAKK